MNAPAQKSLSILSFDDRLAACQPLPNRVGVEGVQFARGLLGLKDLSDSEDLEQLGAELLRLTRIVDAADARTAIGTVRDLIAALADKQIPLVPEGQEDPFVAQRVLQGQSSSRGAGAALVGRMSVDIDPNQPLQAMRAANAMRRLLDGIRKDLAALSGQK